MKRISFLFAILGSLLLGIAESSAQSPSATLQRARTAINHGGVTSTFSSEIYDAQGKQTAQVNGSISMNGHVFRLIYGQITAVYEGKDLIYYDKGQNTITYSRPSTEELAQINPFVFLTDANKAYVIKDLGASKVGPIVGFSPKIRNGIKQFGICFNSQTGLPYTIDGTFDDGSRMSIKILRIETNKKLSESIFKMSAKDFPKAEVIDLR